MLPRLFWSCLLGLLPLLLGAQTDTVPAAADTLGLVDTRIIAEDTNRVAVPAARAIVPKRALLWAIIPGGGQVYNRRWWKVPLVYGGLAGAVGILDYNQSRLNRIKRALLNRCFGPSVDSTCQVVTDEFTNTRFNEITTLRRVRDGYERNRQTAIFGVLAVYLMQGVEAFVDAHLRNFDIEDDIGFRVRPQLLPPGGYAFGLGVEIPLGRSPRPRPPILSPP